MTEKMNLRGVFSYEEEAINEENLLDLVGEPEGDDQLSPWE